MKRVTRFLASLVAAILLLAGSALGKTLVSNPSESDDKTLSPYFFVKSDDPDVDQIPLKSTSARVNIAGVIADVQVTQAYKNEGKKPLEAIYVFPASTRAAVYGMKMTIGQRTIQAKIDRREDARKAYEQARNQGKSASLLEQQRPNVFQMSVANILPEDVITVELKYTELLGPTDRIYEFVYPTVVGPRYTNQHADAAPASERWVQNPYLRQQEVPGYAFDISVSLSAGLPIRDLSCTSHKVNVSYDNPAMASVALDASEKHGGNRDYVLRYRLDGDRVQSGLLLYQGERENFFLLMMQPPKRVKSAHIPGREYIFIVDVSGSMHGFPLEISKKLLKNLIGNLRSTDLFNVLLFSGGSSVMAEESLPATAENINRAVQLIGRQQGGGGTELLPALRRALSLKQLENYFRTVVIATDGFVTVEEEVFDLIRTNLGRANMFPFGIGTSVNRHIIEGMAHVGMGEPFVITSPEQAASKAERFRAMIESPVLTQVNVKFRDFVTYDVEPLTIPDVLAERPVVLFGKWRGKPQGRITLSGIAGEGAYTQTLDVGQARPQKKNSALQYLWARHRITLLSDYNKLRSNDARIKEITDLGLTYNLLTAYTSFVAIDSEVRNRDGNGVTVKQPLPLPQGVSDLAVGGAAQQAFAPRLAAKMAPSGQHASQQDSIAPREQKGIETEEKVARNVKDVTVSRGLTRETILAAAEGYAPEIKKCCAAAGLSGRLVIKITVNPDGTVKVIDILEGASKNHKAKQCITNQVMKWRLPAPRDGLEATATISFAV